MVQCDTPVNVQVHAFVGARGNSVQYHVFQLEQALPKFAMYVCEVCVCVCV
jgi:hypothetical protein